MIARRAGPCNRGHDRGNVGIYRNPNRPAAGDCRACAAMRKRRPVTPLPLVLPGSLEEQVSQAVLAHMHYAALTSFERLGVALAAWQEVTR